MFFEALLAEIIEGDIHLAQSVRMHPAGNADATGLGQSFEPRDEVDPIAENVAVLDDDVALMDAKAKLDPLFGWRACVPVRHRPLHLDGAAHGIDNAMELDQESVAGGLDDAAAMLGDLRIAQFTPDRFQRGEGPFLVRPHQPRIARDIGREDRGESTFDASGPCGLHGASPVVHDPTPTGAARALSKGATSRLRSAANPPHKRPTGAVRFRPQLDLCFNRFR